MSAEVLASATFIAILMVEADTSKQLQITGSASDGLSVSSGLARVTWSIPIPSTETNTRQTQVLIETYSQISLGELA
tara:strand:- start:1253 stop:1483 length:231 start_codon:yes stop_codon:yes gene_type:complete